MDLNFFKTVYKSLSEEEYKPDVSNLTAKEASNINKLIKGGLEFIDDKKRALDWVNVIRDSCRLKEDIVKKKDYYVELISAITYVLKTLKKTDSKILVEKASPYVDYIAEDLKEIEDPKLKVKGIYLENILKWLNTDILEPPCEEEVIFKSVKDDSIESCRKLIRSLRKYSHPRLQVHLKNILSYIEEIETRGDSLDLREKISQSFSKVGMILGQMRLNDAAVEAYQKAIVFSSEGNYLACYNLGVIYERQGDLKAAEILYEQASILAPNFPLPYFNLGAIYATRQKFKKAKEYFEKAVELDKNDKFAHLMLGRVYLDLMEFAEAAERFFHALSLDPEFFDAHFWLARLYRELRIKEFAEAHYAKFKELFYKKMGDSVLIAKYQLRTAIIIKDEAKGWEFYIDGRHIEKQVGRHSGLSAGRHEIVLKKDDMDFTFHIELVDGNDYLLRYWPEKRQFELEERYSEMEVEDHVTKSVIPVSKYIMKDAIKKSEKILNIKREKEKESSSKIKRRGGVAEINKINLLRLLLREVVKDGVISDYEKEVIAEFRSKLEIPQTLYVTILEEELGRVDKEAVLHEDELRPAKLYHLLLEWAVKKGKIMEEEKGLIAEMRKILGISKEEHLKILKFIKESIMKK